MLKKNADLSEIAVVGIQTGGVHFAKRLLNEMIKIKNKTGNSVRCFGYNPLQG